MAPQSSPITDTIQHLLNLYNTYILPQLPDPVQSLSNNITPVLTSLSTSALNGDIVSICAALVTVYISIRMLDYLRRSVIGWIIFGVKILFVLGVVQVGLYANRVGAQKTLGDAEWLLGLLWGFLEDRVGGQGGGGGGGGDNRMGGLGGAGGNRNAGGPWIGGRQQNPLGNGRRKVGFNWR